MYVLAKGLADKEKKQKIHASSRTKVAIHAAVLRQTDKQTDRKAGPSTSIKFTKCKKYRHRSACAYCTG